MSQARKGGVFRAVRRWCILVDRGVEWYQMRGLNVKKFSSG
jgi:hypothetical protein